MKRLRKIPIVCTLFLIGVALLGVPEQYLALQWAHRHSCRFLLELVLHMFSHSGPMHLLGNYMFVFPYALYVEHRVGKKRFMGIWFGTGLVAVASFLLASMPIAPGMGMIGSSGACSGIFGAAAFLLEGPRILKTIGRILFCTQLYVQLSLALFAMQYPMFGSIAYMAHVGGLVSGAIVGHILCKKLRRSVKRRKISR